MLAERPKDVVNLKWKQILTLKYKLVTNTPTGSGTGAQPDGVSAAAAAGTLNAASAARVKSRATKQVTNRLEPLVRVAVSHRQKELNPIVFTQGSVPLHYEFLTRIYKRTKKQGVQSRG